LDLPIETGRRPKTRIVQTVDSERLGDETDRSSLSCEHINRPIAVGRVLVPFRNVLEHLTSHHGRAAPNVVAVQQVGQLSECRYVCWELIRSGGALLANDHDLMEAHRAVRVLVKEVNLVLKLAVGRPVVVTIQKGDITT